MDPDRPDRNDHLIAPYGVSPTPMGAVRIIAAVAVLQLLALPAATAAQTPTHDYWRTLRERDAPQLVLAASAPTSIPEPLGHALRLFRVYEVTGDEGAARHARELLRRADVPARFRGWHLLASAMVLARGPDSRMRDLGDGDAWFVDPNSLGSARSLRMLRAALDEDPAFREAALELATWALDRAHVGVAAEAEIALAAQQVQAGTPDAESLLARTSLNLLLGDFDRAARLAGDAMHAGADRSLALHDRAYALLQEAGRGDAAAERRDAGIAVYFEGAGALSTEGRRAYGRSIAPLLDEAEADAWATLPDSLAEPWLRRFWSRAAARTGVLPEERLAEHYRRVHEARVAFPSAAPLSVLQIQSRFVLRADSRRFGLSLRGLMLVRHGDPLRLAHIEPCLGDPFGSAGAGVGIICPGSGPDRLALFQDAARLTAGESFDPFTRPLAFGYGVYAFRAPDHGTELIFAIALPARSANALVEGTGDLAALVSAIVIPDSGDVLRRDSLWRAPLPARLDAIVGEADAIALMHATLAVPRDEHVDYRVTLSDPGRHAGGSAAGRIEVPAFADFALSDLVISPVDARGSWLRGDFAIALAPLRIYRGDEAFRLYYELYALREDAPYRTEIELLRRPDGLRDRLGRLFGRDDDIRLRFEGRAPAPHPVFGIQEMRIIDLAGIEPGLWTLRVTVRDLESGREVSRETPVDVMP